jgi:hypothetical protein
MGDPNNDDPTGFDVVGNALRFEFDDLKPLDYGIVSFDIDNLDNDAFICARVVEIENNDNGRIDPEIEAGDPDGGAGNGELQNYLTFEFDGGIGSITDVEGEWTEVVAGPVGQGAQTASFGYCFGDWDGANCTLDPAENYNDAQTDWVRADVEFRAVQARNNQNFSCSSLNDPEPPTPPTVETGYSGLTEAAGVRWRGESGGREVYLGIPDLGVGGNRNEVDTSWPTDSSQAVTFVWDAIENTITTEFGGGGPLVYDFDDELAPTCDPADWNTLDILLKDDADNGGTPNVDFNNVVLGGFPLGDFSHTPTTNGSERFQHWTVTGFDFTNSFTMTGDLVVDGTWNVEENTNVQVVVGCTP